MSLPPSPIENSLKNLTITTKQPSLLHLPPRLVRLSPFAVRTTASCTYTDRVLVARFNFHCTFLLRHRHQIERGEDENRCHEHPRPSRLNLCVASFFARDCFEVIEHERKQEKKIEENRLRKIKLGKLSGTGFFLANGTSDLAFGC